MSVTFSVYHNGHFVAPKGWVAEYENDPMYGRVMTNQNPLEMNVANGNYCRIMELLGLDATEYCGIWGDGSLQHVETQLRIALDGLQGVPGLDAGIPSTERKGKNGCRWVDCGVREGYFGERLTTLLEIVKKAIEVGGNVVFG